jgi:hypothetical protein
MQSDNSAEILGAGPLPRAEGGGSVSAAATQHEGDMPGGPGARHAQVC